MNDDIRIATWTPADRDEVIDLIVSIQQGEFHLPITADDQPDLADVDAGYLAMGGEFLVARAWTSDGTTGVRGRVVGTIAAIVVEPNTVAVRKMFVHRDHRGDGLAARLMDELVDVDPTGRLPHDAAGHHRPDDRRAPVLREAGVHAAGGRSVAGGVPADGRRLGVLPARPGGCGRRDQGASHVIDEAVQLYAVDPTEFVAARTRLVRELKAAQRKDDAATVAKLPRPRLGEHLLNLVARHHPAVVSSFAAAVHAATAAQSTAIGSGDGAALRASSAQLRSATTTLVDAALRELQGDGRDAPGRRDEVLTVVRALTNADGRGPTRGGRRRLGHLGHRARPVRRRPRTTPVRKRAAPGPARRSNRRRSPTPAEPTTPAPPSRAELAAERRRRAQLERATTALHRAERELSAAQRATDAAAIRLAAAETARAEAAADLGRSHRPRTRSWGPLTTTTAVGVPQLGQLDVIGGDDQAGTYSK